MSFNKVTLRSHLAVVWLLGATIVFCSTSRTCQSFQIPVQPQWPGVAPPVSFRSTETGLFHTTTTWGNEKNNNNKKRSWLSPAFFRSDDTTMDDEAVVPAEFESSTNVRSIEHMATFLAVRTTLALLRTKLREAKLKQEQAKEVQVVDRLVLPEVETEEISISSSTSNDVIVLPMGATADMKETIQEVFESDLIETAATKSEIPEGVATVNENKMEKVEIATPGGAVLLQAPADEETNTVLSTKDETEDVTLLETPGGAVFLAPPAKVNDNTAEGQLETPGGAVFLSKTDAEERNQDQPDKEKVKEISATAVKLNDDSEIVGADGVTEEERPIPLHHKEGDRNVALKDEFYPKDEVYPKLPDVISFAFGKPLEVVESDVPALRNEGVSVRAPATKNISPSSLEATATFVENDRATASESDFRPTIFVPEDPRNTFLAVNTLTQVELEGPHSHKHEITCGPDNDETPAPHVESPPLAEDKPVVPPQVDPVQMKNIPSTRLFKKRAFVQPRQTIDEASMSVPDRAWAILLDLGMVQLTPDPRDPDYDHSEDDLEAPENVWIKKR